jgi:hypothetical protein
MGNPPRTESASLRLDIMLSLPIWPLPVAHGARGGTGPNVESGRARYRSVAIELTLSLYANEPIEKRRSVGDTPGGGWWFGSGEGISSASSSYRRSAEVGVRVR